MHKFLFVAALALVVSAPSQGADQISPSPKIPVADFASLPVLQKPLLSADGRRIAARRITDGKTKIVILNTDQPEAPLRLIDIDKTRIAAARWAGNHRLLLTVLSSRKLAGGYELPFLRLFAADVETGALRLVDNRSRGLFAGDVLYTHPNGSWALVAGQDDALSYPSVKRIDLATGEAVVVEKPKHNVWDWYADENGVVRAGVAYEGRRWTVWYRDKPDEKLRSVRGKLSRDDDSTVDRFIFRGEKSWIVTNELTGRFGLYKYDTKTGDLGEAIFEHAEVDLDDVTYNAVTGEIRSILYEDDRPRVHWIDPDMKALQARLDHALPNTINLPVDWSTDEERVLVWSAGAADPGRYFLLDAASSKMHPVVDPYPRIDPALLADMKVVRYQARDGLLLRAYLTLPRGRTPKGLPLILMPHGGPFERDRWKYDATVQFLANRGYAVLQPQFRGSTGYGKDLVAKGYGEWGRGMQDDLDDGVDWLARTGQINPQRVCIVGGSYGGYAAMWGAIRNPERYRCAASFASISDVPAMLRYDRKLFSAPRYYREWRTKVSGEGKTDLASVSPIQFADRLRIPLFIAHGEQDDNVPPKQSREMVEALRKAGADVTSVFYKDSGHGLDSSADMEDWLRRLENFLAKHNPA